MKKVVQGLMFVGCIFLSGVSQGALISIDLQGKGDGLITRDTQTDLDWLDVSHTTSISFNQMLEELKVGGKFYGFRYATRSELNVLKVNAGFWEGNFSVINPYYTTLGENLIKILGMTYSDPLRTSFGIWGLLAEPFTGTAIQDRVALGFNRTLAFSASSSVISDNESLPWLGSWLVRPTPVNLSEPNSLVSLMLGLLALIFIRRRTSSK